MIATLLTAARLCGALVTLHGAEVSPHRLCRAAVIIAHVADEWPPELLAAIAFRESRFDASAVNALTRCWGPMQVNTRRRDRSEWAGYVAGVAKLREARRYCARAPGNGPGLLCTLAGYASGPAGVRGRWYRGPRRVEREAARVRAAMRTTNPAPSATTGRA